MLQGRLGFLPRRGDTEDTLVRAARRGSREAFDRLIQAHIAVLRGYVARRVGPTAADDVMQETLLAGWLGLANHNGRGRFKTWLFGIAAHKCADHLRQCARAGNSVPLDDAAATPASGNHYDDALLREVVRQTLRELPAELRDVLELYYYAELTLVEVAQALARNPNTVKAQFYRAHAQAARLLESGEEPTR